MRARASVVGVAEARSFSFYLAGPGFACPRCPKYLLTPARHQDADEVGRNVNGATTMCGLAASFSTHRIFPVEEPGEMQPISSAAVVNI